MSRPDRPFHRAGLSALLAAATLLCAAPGQAQPQEPVPRFVVDARAAIPFLPNDPAVAEPRDIGVDQLPSYGLGLDVGAHVYPLRWKAVTFGIGASYHTSRGSRTPEVPEGSTAEPGPTVQARLTAFSPQVSFNFGHRMGWSYISGGIGRATFRAWREDLAEEPGESTKTINYGGGARWFVRDHLAFSLDLRFYAMNPLEPGESTAGHSRMTLAAVTAGVSFR
jgi:hypothetical protein